MGQGTPGHDGGPGDGIGENDAGAPPTQDDAGRVIDPPPETREDGGVPIPKPPTTVDRRIVPTHALEDGTHPNPAYADARADALALGYGAYDYGGGELHQPRTLDGGSVPSLGPKARRLLRFAHLADLQLTDDESTTRVATLDSRGATSSALRTQDAYLCHLANAAVRAINREDEADPVAFTVLGGDNIDNAQPNELDWLLGIFSGDRPVACDSGDVTDLVAGPLNDPKDPFMPEGLATPWLWVSGNHDEEVQGNLAVSNTLRANATSSFCALGTRDYSDPDEIRQGTGFVADDAREPMFPAELMARLAAVGDGHGIGADQVERGKAFYHYDVPDAPVRFVVMDTAAETGGAEGMLRRADVDAFVAPAIEEARALGRIVILVSHHAIDALTTDGGTLGTTQEGAMLPQDFRAFLAGYDHVLFSLVGHAHAHDARPIEAGSHAYWEVQTASIADFPHQLRMVELWDGDNGHFMLRATAIDVDTSDDALAEQGRVLGIVDYTTGWAVLGPPPPAGRTNVELWIRAPLEGSE